jgi:hypothetical protein
VTIQELTYLASDAGRLLLETAKEVEGDSLKKQSVLRRDFSAEYVRAALTLLDLRTRAGAKFDRADEMFFDRDGLEQASGDVIAAHRAKRYAPFNSVVDICCGVGGDTVALASVAEVAAIDVRPERVWMTRENVKMAGGSGQYVCADVGRWCPSLGAAFIDPSRREGGRRVVNLADYAPPVDDLGWLPNYSAVGIKVAPGIDHDAVPDGCEIEFISVNGECREAVLWFGDLRTEARVRATLLPGGVSVVGEDSTPVGCSAVSDYVYEPDRAIIRAHLVEQVAASIDAQKIAADVAYLTSKHRVESTYVRGFRVEEVMDFSLRRVQSYVSAQGIGRLDIKKRRFPMTPDEVFGKLKLKGSNRATLILTRVDEDPVAIFCQPI